MPRVTITVPDKNAQPYRFQLDREVVTLGRGSENDIVVESGSVSVNHAEMRRLKGGYELHDVGSTNGIKLDGLRLLSIPLRNGAQIHIGDVAFDFILTDEELEVLAGEKPGGMTQASVVRGAEIPSAAPKPVRQPTSYTPASSGSGFGATLLFVLFAVIAFYAGLAIRHQKETGGSLFDAIRANQTSKPAPAAPGAQ
ncbi:MAG: FHA domain-containing protein [Verrucomicrobiota bacterium]